MSEYQFVYGSRVQAGRTVFTVGNAGRLPHQLSLFALAEDAPPIKTQVLDPAGIQITPLQQMPVLQPGEQGGSFAVDLEPGARYAMVSLWSNSDGKADALLGMSTEFRAARRPRTTSGPTG